MNALQNAVKNIIENLNQHRFIFVRNEEQRNITENISQGLEMMLQSPIGLKAVTAVLINNMKAGAYSLIMLDDGPPKDVTAENIKNLKRAYDNS